MDEEQAESSKSKTPVSQSPPPDTPADAAMDAASLPSEDTSEDTSERKATETTAASAETAVSGWFQNVTRERVTSWLKLAGWIAAGTAGSLTLMVGAASYPLSNMLIRPNPKRRFQLKSPHLRAFLKKRGIKVEDVTVASFDDTKLFGWWLPAAAAAPTVIVIHGVTKNRTDVLRAAFILREAGFNILVFDGRAHGDSEGHYVTYGFYERRDVEAVADWLAREKQVDKTRLGLAGESMGAAIALQVAAHTDWVRCVWADSPFASLRRVSHEFMQRATRLPNTLLNPVMWTARQMANYRGKFDIETIEPVVLASHIKCPVMLIHGTADQLISTAHSQHIYDALQGDKELWIVEGVRHARAARHAKREYRERLTRFFQHNLLEKIAAEENP